MKIRELILLCVASVSAAQNLLRADLRTDQVPVQLLLQGALAAEFALQSRSSTRSPPIAESFVSKALAAGIDWREQGAVTPAKDQGALGYCGTFGRTAAAEGQFAIHAGQGLRNFSEEELVDCIGWDKDQFTYFAANGFMDSADYPYNGTGHNQDPPIPGRSCKYEKSKVIEGTEGGKYTKSLSVAHDDEAQLAAWIFKNGPVNTGIDASVFGLREKGCEATNSCFITKEMCANSTAGIDHSITLTGFGTDPVLGPYWIVKNSWSTAFANEGFIKVARGFSGQSGTDGCAHIACCGWVPCYGTCPV